MTKPRPGGRPAQQPGAGAEHDGASAAAHLRIRRRRPAGRLAHRAGRCRDTASRLTPIGSGDAAHDVALGGERFHQHVVDQPGPVVVEVGLQAVGQARARGASQRTAATTGKSSVLK